MTSDLREAKWRLTLEKPTLRDSILGLTNENPLLREKKDLQF